SQPYRLRHRRQGQRIDEAGEIIRVEIRNRRWRGTGHGVRKHPRGERPGGGERGTLHKSATSSQAANLQPSLCRKQGHGNGFSRAPCLGTAQSALIFPAVAALNGAAAGIESEAAEVLRMLKIEHVV